MKAEEYYNEINKADMRLLSHFQKVNSVDQIPTKGTFFVLTRSTTFLGRAIQGFMRLAQWLHITKDTDHIPNHADIVCNGRAIGALEKGVACNSVKKHFKQKEGTEYFIINISANKLELRWMWMFAVSEVGKPYKYFDLIEHIKQVFTRFWYGEDSDDYIVRDKWTCYSLVASCYEYAIDKTVFTNLSGISPYEFCKIIDEREDLFY